MQHYVFWLLHVLLLVAGAQAKVPAVIVFGDSSVDAGNNNYIPTIARSNFEPYGRDFSGGRPTGRFSNGKIPPDFLSEAFHIKPSVPAYLDPAYNISDFATGVTFASAGSGYDNATSDVLVSLSYSRVYISALDSIFFSETLRISLFLSYSYLSYFSQIII